MILSAGIKILNTTVTGIAPEAVIAATSGISISLVSVIATNQSATTRAISFYEGDSKITPSMHVASSGTLFWENIAGGHFHMATGSGLFAALDTAGSVEIAAYYSVKDNSTPTTPAQADTVSYTASLNPPKATRTPNRFGAQQEG